MGVLETEKRKRYSKCSKLLWVSGIALVSSMLFGLVLIFIISIILCSYGIIWLYDLKAEEDAENLLLSRMENLSAKEKIFALTEKNEEFQILDKMCSDNNFDSAEAQKIINQIDLSELYVPENGRYKYTLLEKAVQERNIEMVELLLKNGADPNSDGGEGDSIFYNLQWLDETEEEKEHEERFSKIIITKAMLDYGANPVLVPEPGCEDLFSYVCYNLFNDTGSMSDEELYYLTDFFTLLVIYGGKTDYCAPRIIGEFDMCDVFQYHFEYIRHSDGEYRSACIKDRNDKIIAYI